MLLGGYDLETESLPYIIAEIGVNHEGSLEKAFLMIRDAKEAGANAVKFQTYKAEKIAAVNSPSYWDLSMEPTKSQYELFKKHDTFSEEDYLSCKKYCDDIGIDFLSTAFDLDSLNFIDPLVPFHKISSSDISNVPFLRAVAKTRKPVVLSTGASTYDDIDFALKELRDNGCTEIVLLHCILNYPTPFENAHLNTIKGLQQHYPELIIGLSDHTLADPDMLSVTTAFCLGAKVIEKHYTYDKSIFGSDHKHSMDKDDLQKLVSNIKFVAPLFGMSELAVLPQEEISRANARRSIFYAKDLNAGHVLTEDDLICKRPALWVSSTNWDELIGKTLMVSVSSDDPVSYTDFQS